MWKTIKGYDIVAGERRYRAAKLAGLKSVPCIVRNFTDLQRMEVSLIENIQRENLNPVEEARAYAYLLTQSGIKQEDLAKRVGKAVLQSQTASESSIFPTRCLMPWRKDISRPDMPELF